MKGLEAQVASLLGVEDTVYVSTGTIGSMSNQIAVRTRTEPGNAVLLGQSAPIYLNEAGWRAALSGVLPTGPDSIRAVPYLNIPRAQIEEAFQIIRCI